MGIMKQRFVCELTNCLPKDCECIILYCAADFSTIRYSFAFVTKQRHACGAVFRSFFTYAASFFRPAELLVL
jgi:hypothetical protein